MFIHASIILIAICTGGAVFALDNPDRVGRYGEVKFGLPVIPESREAVYDYYRLCFMVDMTPGRYVDNICRKHPMYAAYLMGDYLVQYKKSGDILQLRAAENILNNAVSNMHQSKNALIYYFTPESVVTAVTGKHYSGLTQSNYLKYTTQLYQITRNKKYKEIARKLFNSLTLSENSGGVAKYTDHGAHIKEYQTEYDGWTLNGWITAVNNIFYYYKYTKDAEANDFLTENMKLLERLLPLYDHEEYHNTRYQLANPFYIKFVARGGVTVSDFVYEIPMEGSYDMDFSMIKPTGSRNGYTVRRCVGECQVDNINGSIDFNKLAVFNVVGSLISHPKTNKFSYKVKSNGAKQIQIYIAQGVYDPFTTVMPTESWVLVDELVFSDTKDVVEKTTEVPERLLDKIIYPTNFKKKIGGKNYNAYHFIHIVGLAKINSWYKSEELQKYINKWNKYVNIWPSSEFYKNKDIEFIKYSNKIISKPEITEYTLRTLLKELLNDSHRLFSGSDHYAANIRKKPHAMAQGLLLSTFSRLNMRVEADQLFYDLVSSANKDKSGGVAGWGLGFEHDAFSDGTINPPSTIYTITNAIVGLGVLDYYDTFGNESALDSIIQMAEGMNHFVNNGMDDFYYWYSDQVNDEIFTPNVNSMMALLNARLWSYSKNEMYFQKADLLLNKIKDTSINKNDYLYWKYSSNSEDLNDLVHHSYIHYGIVESQKVIKSTVFGDSEIESSGKYLNSYLRSDGFLYEYSDVHPLGVKLNKDARLWGVAMYLASADTLGVDLKVESLLQKYVDLDDRTFVTTPDGDTEESRHIAHMLFGLTKKGFLK